MNQYTDFCDAVRLAGALDMDAEGEALWAAYEKHLAPATDPEVNAMATQLGKVFLGYGMDQAGNVEDLREVVMWGVQAMVAEGVTP